MGPLFQLSVLGSIDQVGKRTPQLLKPANRCMLLQHIIAQRNQIPIHIALPLVISVVVRKWIPDGSSAVLY